jgi:hypothetical protein
MLKRAQFPSLGQVCNWGPRNKLTIGILNVSLMTKNQCKLLSQSFTILSFLVASHINGL